MKLRLFSCQSTDETIFYHLKMYCAIQWRKNTQLFINYLHYFGMRDMCYIFHSTRLPSTIIMHQSHFTTDISSSTRYCRMIGLLYRLRYCVIELFTKSNILNWTLCWGRRVETLNVLSAMSAEKVSKVTVVNDHRDYKANIMGSWSLTFCVLCEILPTGKCGCTLR